MQELNLHAITNEKLSIPLFKEKGVEADVLRLDKMHEIISGNKWFKLRYYLEDAMRLGKHKLLTFGGAWSNHILATAGAARLYGFSVTGIIRGEAGTVLSPTLIQATELGMELVFTNREDYSLKKIPPELEKNEHYLIPEGGYGRLGAEGAARIFDHCVREKYTHICCAAGTGTMMAGLINAALVSQKIIGVSILKNNEPPEESIRSLLRIKNKPFHITRDYHFNGYARHQPELLSFMNAFYRQCHIPSDFVYTGKLFYAVNDMVSGNFFSPGSRLLIIHSGGLQGNASLEKGTLIF